MAYLREKFSKAQWEQGSKGGLGDEGEKRLTQSITDV